MQPSKRLVRNHNRLIAVCISLALVLFASACGESKSTTSSTTETTAIASFPVTVKSMNGDVTIKEQPKRVISLSPTATEILFAVGADKQVVAVDNQSNFPANAPKSELSGMTPNIEAITKLKPDLVVVSYDANGIVNALGKVSVAVIVQPTAMTLEDAYQQVDALGKATGHIDKSNDTVKKMRDGIDKAVKNANDAGNGLTFYHEVDNTYYSLTSKTVTGEIYAKFGLKNIADEAPKAQSGYPQLSGEYIIGKNPNLIFLADSKCCGQSQDTVAKRPGWGNLNGVKNNPVVSLDDDVASRWGPRVVNFAEIVSNATKAAKK